MDDLYLKLLILRAPGIGPAGYNKIINQFNGDLKLAVKSLAPDSELINLVTAEIEMAKKFGIQYLTNDDSRYPKILKEIKNHPPILTIRGNMDVFLKPSIAIVGTRHSTGAGMRFVSQTAKEFADMGYVIVSGMAMGTDTAAHFGALQSDKDNAVTIAVLAGGADYYWPLENESLYEKIIQRGAIVSEMPVGFMPNRSSFAQRNKWIAGLSEKLILGEADLKSGSIQTVNFSIRFGRKVLAIPSHPSDPRSFGPNKLIKDTKAELFLGTEIKFVENKSKKEDKFGNKNKNELISQENEFNNNLLDKLGIIPLSESVLANLVKKDIREVKSTLVVLELQGLVRKQDGGYTRI